jgi:hypothetical protein
MIRGFLSRYRQRRRIAEIARGINAGIEAFEGACGAARLDVMSGLRLRAVKRGSDLGDDAERDLVAALANYALAIGRASDDHVMRSLPIDVAVQVNRFLAARAAHLEEVAELAAANA